MLMGVVETERVEGESEESVVEADRKYVEEEIVG